MTFVHSLSLRRAREASERRPPSDGLSSHDADIHHEGVLGLDEESDTLQIRTSQGELAGERVGLSSTPSPPPPIEPDASRDAAEVMQAAPRKSLVEQTKPRRFSMVRRRDGARARGPFRFRAVHLTHRLLHRLSPPSRF